MTDRLNFKHVFFGELPIKEMEFILSLLDVMSIINWAFLKFQFKDISQAYEVLADKKKRELYDKGGEQAIKEGGIDREFHNPMDIFDMFFGGGGGRGGGGRGPKRGKDVVHQLKVSLEDVYNGTSRKLALQKNVICEKCEGALDQASV